MDVVEQAKQFLKSYLEDKQCDYAVYHPWRRDGNFLILHSLRVHQYALNLIEAYDLEEEEKQLTECAALLHDLGRAGETREEHGKRSARIVSDWLDTLPNSEDKINVDRLLKMIENHSDKESEDDDLCTKILKDADLLDEVGILSLYLTSYRVSNESSFYFNALLNKIKSMELDYARRAYQLIKTDTAKSIMKEKLRFIEHFINQLELEIKGTQSFYQEWLSKK